MAGTTATVVEIAELIAATEDAEARKAADSRTRITAIARDNRANRAGSTQSALAGRPAKFPARKIQGDLMATSKSTFQKRQKEMKRQEKQRMKAERRAQKKLAGPSEGGPLIEPYIDPLGAPDILTSDPDSQE